jgi:hypothetical protein
MIKSYVLHPLRITHVQSTNYIRMYIGMHVCMHAYMFVKMYDVYINVYMRECIYVFTYECMYTHSRYVVTKKYHNKTSIVK